MMKKPIVTIIILIAFYFLSSGVSGKSVFTDNLSGGLNCMDLYATGQTAVEVLPTPVAKAALNVNSSSFLASWDPVPNATHYKLYVKNFTTGDFILDGIQLTTTSYIVSHLQASTKYVYYLYAANSTTNSGLSNVIQVTTTGVPAPVALQATVVLSDAFRSDWNKVDGATSYRVYYGKVGDPASEKSIETSLTHKDIYNLEPYTWYWYRVRAYIGTEQSGLSNEILVRTAFSTPVVKDATNVTSTSFIANWEEYEMENVTGYRLDVWNITTNSAVSEFWNKIVSGTSITVTGLAPGNEYKYQIKVQFFYGANETGYSNYKNVTTTPLTNYSLALSANPTAGGTVSGGGSFASGTSVTAVATVNSGYQFVNWTENGSPVSTSANYPFSISANRTLVANFAEIPPATYTVAVAVIPANSGTASGGGIFNEGSSVTVTATPAEGFSFVNWTDGGIEVSADAAYTFTATSDRSLVANFEQNTATNYSIVVTASPSNMGSAGGGGTYAKGSSVTVTATSMSRIYRFVNWTDGGTIVSTNAVYTFTARADRNLVANFEQNTGTNYTIVVTASPSNMGSAVGGGTYAKGSSITVTATPAEGFRFVNWTDGGTEVSTSAAYTFTATADRNLVANFEQNASVNYTIAVTASPSNMGSVSGGGTYAEGSSVALTATPASRVYRFVNWTDGGTEVSTSAVYTFTATADRNLVANFEQNPATTYSVDVAVLPANSGTSNGGGTFNEGSSVTVTATPAEGFVFVNWTEGDAEVSADAEYTFALTADRNLVANFEPEAVQNYTVTLQVSGLGGTVNFSSQSFEPGALVTIVATPAEEYGFSKWMEGSTLISTTHEYTFLVGGDITLTAYFDKETAVGLTGESNVQV
ncbi:MAG TPA: fibronectin type III domain-containing protein, partial [Prolixibacteraceae bacterium]|nr:fibronectin type III domain-containing protein [Prolixibacteraceae bacterium]